MSSRTTTKGAWRRTAWISAGLLLASALAACGGSPSAPSVDITLFGWDDETTDFTRDLANYTSASQLQIKLTRPRRQELVEAHAFDISDNEGEVPELAFGEGLRLDFDLINQTGSRIATGATPVFQSGPEADDREFSVMVAPPREFAPVGAQFRAPEDSSEDVVYSQVKFDDRTDDERNFARIGHRAARSDQGSVLVVGGGQVDRRNPPSMPELTEVLGDVQRFNSATGYISDLAFNEKKGEQRDDGGDRLEVPRAYHSVTHIGNGEFLVIGGLTLDGGSTRTTGAIEVIDLNADPGDRVVWPVDNEEERMTLDTPRAMHTATYRKGKDHVVVVGGTTGDGATASVEIVDLDQRKVYQAGELDEARIQHETLRMGDGQGSLLAIGGRNGSGALDSTELVRVGEEKAESVASTSMNQSRYDFGAVRVRPTVAAVFGGFTSTDDSSGVPTRECQLLVLRGGGVEKANSWSLHERRGGADAVQLTQSNTTVLIGGRDSEGEVVERAVGMLPTKDNPMLTPQDGDRGTMDATRFDPSVTQLTTGNVLLTGGRGPQGGPLPSLEYYNPADVVAAQSGEDGG